MLTTVVVVTSSADVPRHCACLHMSDCSTNGKAVEVVSMLRHIGCTSAQMYTQFSLSEVCVMLVLFIVCCWCCCAFCKIAFCFDSLALQGAITAVAPVHFKAQRNAKVLRDGTTTVKMQCNMHHISLTLELNVCWDHSVQPLALHSRY
jgi:hypothetical protein